MTGGKLATCCKGEFASDTPTSSLEGSSSRPNLTDLTTDNGNNGSFIADVMNLSGLSEKTDGARGTCRATTTEQNGKTSLLPLPVSPSNIHTLLQASKCNLTKVVSEIVSPRLLRCPVMQISPRNSFSQNASFGDPKMDIIRSETKLEISEYLNVSPLNSELYAKLLETSKKFKTFKNENDGNSGRQIPSSPSDSDCDKSGNNYEDGLVREKNDVLERSEVADDDSLHDNQNMVNNIRESPSKDVHLEDPIDNDDDDDISPYTTSYLSGNEDSSTPERIEGKGKESSSEVFSLRNVDSSTLNEMDILEEANSASLNIPRFHYPCGIPHYGKESYSSLAVTELFQKYNNRVFQPFNFLEVRNVMSVRQLRRVDLEHVKEICLIVDLCPLWKKPLYNCLSTSTSNFITFIEFANWWRRFEEHAHDEASRFVYILTNGRRNFLTADDFEALIQDLIETLPSLGFLKEALVFHQAYIKTVITRIFWTVCHSWKKHISIVELRLSNLLKAITMLERADVNEEREFFSYEHFYVIYCNFCILDTGDKNYLTPLDLSLYSNGALTNLVVQRIFSGAVSLNNLMEQVIDYGAFVNFLLAEVDKCHPKSIEYWCRIMDLNGDGRISFDEMEQFYNEIKANVVRMDMNAIAFSNLINQLRDMISPNSLTYFTLSDLKQSPPLARYFFNTFINWIKHVTQESCLLHNRNEMDPQLNDWSCFCKSEYSILVADLLND